MAQSSQHPWDFRARFRRRAFGWKSQPAIKRIKEAVTELKTVARTDQLLAADGAVLFLEKVSPAIEQVDSSSGAIGTAVNHAVTALVEIIAQADAEPAHIRALMDVRHAGVRLEAPTRGAAICVCDALHAASLVTSRMKGGALGVVGAAAESVLTADASVRTGAVFGAVDADPFAADASVGAAGVVGAATAMRVGACFARIALYVR